jgi:hypothetical protein
VMPAVGYPAVEQSPMTAAVIRFQGEYVHGWGRFGCELCRSA